MAIPTRTRDAKRDLGHKARQRWWSLLLLTCLMAALGWAPIAVAAAESSVVVHTGPCNASAALALGGGLFVVADDEERPPVTLRVYRSGQAGPAVGEGTIPAAAVAPVKDGHPELDLEGSARIGPLAYWIGSHGAAEAKGKGGKSGGARGEPRPNHRRLFATTLGVRGSGKGIALTVEPMGRAYTTLIEDLAADPRYGRFALAAAAERPAKAKGGLNIEGLAATASGGLLIGFRNPLPEGKALVATLTNPNAVIAGEKPRFGDPVLLDLGGLGIRSLEWVKGQLLIVAGPAEGSKGKTPPSVLYRWSGQASQAAEQLRTFGPVDGVPLNPEGLFVDGDSLVVISDDGKLERNGKACEDRPKAKQGFREIRLMPLPQAPGSRPTAHLPRFDP
ncbi:MAG: DUF3616 domain-containing protein [Cyanobacteriota bacterium]